ncbi:MAG: helix-turn-helix domain-containing protein [Syntrophales bacterium]|jgi:transcriptional regulator with PAS, ATPase and Fis domain
MKSCIIVNRDCSGAGCLGWENGECLIKIALSIYTTHQKPKTTTAINAQYVDFSEGGIDLNVIMDELEKSLITKALIYAKGNKTTAANLLHVSHDSFRYRIEKLGITDDIHNKLMDWISKW